MESITISLTINQKRNVIFIINLQKILSSVLLLVVTGEQERNFSDEIQIKTSNNLPTMIFCKNVVKIL